MRGHQTLLDMRRRGRRPAVVFFDFGSDEDGWWKLWPVECPWRAHVEIADAEMLSGLDIRFVRGMPVFIHGSDVRRVTALQESCLEVGATRVVAAVTRVVPRGTVAVDVEVVSLTDMKPAEAD